MQIIKISAMWCGSCLITNKHFKKLKEEYLNNEYIEYDYDMNNDKIQKYNVGNTLPVIIFIKDNQEVKRLVGEKKYEDLKKEVEELNGKIN